MPGYKDEFRIHPNVLATLRQTYDRYFYAAEPIFNSQLKPGGRVQSFEEFINVLLLRACVDYHKQLDDLEGTAAMISENTKKEELNKGQQNGIS